MLRGIFVEVELNLRCGVDGALVFGNVVLINGARNGERREAVETLFLSTLAVYVSTSYGRKRYFVEFLAVNRVDIKVCGSVLAVSKYEFVVGKLHVFEHALAFGDELFPVFKAWLVYVGNHYTATWRTIVGEQIDVVADGFDGAVLQIHIGSHLYELRVWHTKVAHV